MATNFKEEVLKVCPDAYEYTRSYSNVIYIKDRYTLQILGSGYFIEQAWESAYNNIKNQNK